MTNEDKVRGLSVAEYVEGVLTADRGILARAITLVESRNPANQVVAQEVSTRLLPSAGGAHRIGISGVPGVGKSTLIDTLGVHLLEQGHRVAVLAVDPSSTLSGGSILGDKSRMPRLTNLPNAFIRPSPNALSPGGVARRSRETLLICEAAGFDVVLVETVGVGQSETVVAEMVDTFVLLLLAGAGDELQGIKKGIVELADVMALTKADGDNRSRAESAALEYQGALRFLTARSPYWQPSVLAISAHTGAGLEELWHLIQDHHKTLVEHGDLEKRRREQRRSWMWSLIEERLLGSFRTDPKVQSRLARIEKEVVAGATTPTQAAADLLAVFEPESSSSTK